MADHARSDPARSRQEFATYVAQLTAELSVSARGHGLDALGYLLDMAQLEAENAAQPAAGEGEPKAAFG